MKGPYFIKVVSGNSYVTAGENGSTRLLDARELRDLRNALMASLDLSSKRSKTREVMEKIKG